MALGAAWARGDLDRDDEGERARAVRDAAAMGIRLDLPADDGAGAWLWAEHAAAWAAWGAVCGQWRVVAAGLGGMVWLGLDYAAAEAGLALAGIALAPAGWDELRLIEAGARAELNREL